MSQLKPVFPLIKPLMPPRIPLNSEFLVWNAKLIKRSQDRLGFCIICLCRGSPP